MSLNIQSILYGMEELIPSESLSSSVRIESKDYDFSALANQLMSIPSFMAGDYRDLQRLKLKLKELATRVKAESCLSSQIEDVIRKVDDYRQLILGSAFSEVSRIEKEVVLSILYNRWLCILDPLLKNIGIDLPDEQHKDIFNEKQPWEETRNKLSDIIKKQCDEKSTEWVMQSIDQFYSMTQDIQVEDHQLIIEEFEKLKKWIHDEYHPNELHKKADELIKFFFQVLNQKGRDNKALEENDSYLWQKDWTLSIWQQTNHFMCQFYAQQGVCLGATLDYALRRSLFSGREKDPYAP